jgi:hypothetical protein
LVGCCLLLLAVMVLCLSVDTFDLVLALVVAPALVAPTGVDKFVTDDYT